MWYFYNPDVTKDTPEPPIKITFLPSYNQQKLWFLRISLIKNIPPVVTSQIVIMNLQKPS